MTLKMFALDEALTDVDVNNTGWRLPQESGVEGFANSRQCYVNGGEMVLKGILIFTGDFSSPHAVAKIRRDLAPAGPAHWAWTKDAVGLYATIDPAPSLIVTFGIDNATIGADSDGLVYGHFECRYPLASAVA